MAYHKDRLKALRERAGANMADNDVAAPTSVDASSTSSSSSLSSESSATVGLVLFAFEKLVKDTCTYFEHKFCVHIYYTYKSRSSFCTRVYVQKCSVSSR